METDEARTLRPLSAELNILTRSDGSALVTQGNFKIQKNREENLKAKNLNFRRIFCSLLNQWAN